MSNLPLVFFELSLSVALPAMMNTMPAPRLILALVEFSKVLTVRQLRENIDANSPRTLSTTPTVIRACTACRAPGKKTHN